MKPRLSKLQGGLNCQSYFLSEHQNFSYQNCKLVLRVKFMFEITEHYKCSNYTALKEYLLLLCTGLNYETVSTSGATAFNILALLSSLKII